MSPAIVNDLGTVLQIERLIAERKIARLKRRSIAYSAGGLCLAVAWVALTVAAVLLLAEIWALPHALLAVAGINALAAMAITAAFSGQHEDPADAALRDLRGKSLDLMRRDATDALGGLVPGSGSRASNDTVRLVEQLLPVVLPLVLQAASHVTSRSRPD